MSSVLGAVVHESGGQSGQDEADGLLVDKVLLHFKAVTERLLDSSDEWLLDRLRQEYHAEDIV